VRRAQDDDGACDRVAEDGVERDGVVDGDRGSPSGNADSRVMIIV
jgi:hypothetical protein